MKRLSIVLIVILVIQVLFLAPALGEESDHRALMLLEAAMVTDELCWSVWPSDTEMYDLCTAYRIRASEKLADEIYGTTLSSDQRTTINACVLVNHPDYAKILKCVNDNM